MLMLDTKSFDWSQFDAYRKENVRDNECYNSFAKGEDVLRIWAQMKSRHLAQLFPEHQLVIERPIRYERDESEMRKEMCDLLDDFHSFQMHFRDKLRIYMDPEGLYGHHYIGNSGWSTYDDYDKQLCIMENIMGWLNINLLMENEIRLPYQVTRYELDIAGHKLMLQQGMKLMKTLGKICSWIGLDEEFEQFRIRQSQVTNAKVVTGTACLSIHPLDFATASDNDNGWSSCMSWRESGCYRMGTVEMMNSPIVLCSYIKSDKQQMEIADQEWNSKKWRAWIIVHPQAIMVNRHYPFHSNAISKFMVEWVRELVQERLGWTYEETIYEDLIDRLDVTDHHVHFITNFMYNDVSDDDMGVMSNDPKIEDQWQEEINFSGPAQCMWCGEEVIFDNNQSDADTLGCNNGRMYTCQDCGHEMDEDEVYYGPSGEVWCADCWSDHCVTCDDCGDSVYRDDTRNVFFPLHGKLTHEYYKKYKDEGDKNPLIERMTVSRWRGGMYHPLYGFGSTICTHCLHHRYGGIQWVHFDECSEWGNGDPCDEVVPDARNSSLTDALRCFQPAGYRYLDEHRTAIWGCDDEDFERIRAQVKEFYVTQWAALAEAQQKCTQTTKHGYDEPWLTAEGE